MPDEPLALVIVVVALAIGFAIANGYNDAANAIATTVSTRSLSPRGAVLLATMGNFAGSFTGTILGAQVAKTIGKGIVEAEALTLMTIAGGVGAVTLWGFFATRRGWPISLSHGLVAGLVGAGLAIPGHDTIVWHKLLKVVSAVGFAPLAGFIGGFLFMILVAWAFRTRSRADTRWIFVDLQILAGGFMAYSHGKNDGQMPVGLIAAALMVYHGSSDFHIPIWVNVVSASAISLGTALGGQQVIKTVGMRLTTLRPVHGFSATTAAASVIEIASHYGMPVSTTHIMTTSVMGVGATKRLTNVRWEMAEDILLVWILTFPICAAIGWLLVQLLDVFF